MQKEPHTSVDLDQIKSGKNFLGILNDIKRRPEDASKELNIPLNEIESIIQGIQPITTELVNKAVEIWPVNARDFYIVRDDCPFGVKIMKSEDSVQSSRIMERAGKPYYEYRDTAMSTVAPFRPEWILELCNVNDNEPTNPDVQWNNGHFMHQFTYFIGEVNFYYESPNGEKKIAIMNTGDSMYITPFTKHSFATRKGSKKNGLILAITYGGKLTGDVQQELSALSVELGSNFALDFSSNESASGTILNYHRNILNLTLEELSRITSIELHELKSFENGLKFPTISDLKKLASALTVNIRDLLPNDKTEDKVIVKYHSEGRSWSYPENSNSYEFHELASSTALPFSKSFEVQINDSNNSKLDLGSGLHQYVYNIGNDPVSLSWKLNNEIFSKSINPNDSLYIKPFIEHNFRGNGKLLILRIGGKIVGDSQRELSIIGKKNAERAISETIQWFDSKGKN